MKEKLLVKRGYLLAHEEMDQMNCGYYNAKLISDFGVIVDKPELLTQAHVKLIANTFGINIPKSFYENPQDLKYFTMDELKLEQLVSYVQVNQHLDSEDASVFDRVEIFKKALPDYKEGEEVTYRNYQILTAEQAAEVLSTMASDFAKYTRKWSEDESKEFQYLYTEGYFKGDKLASKDNAVEMFNLYHTPVFAKSLDKKDVVKLSIEMKGEVKSQLNFTKAEKDILRVALTYSYDTPLTKKQAKYVNTLYHKLEVRNSVVKPSNAQSPYKKAKELLSNDDVVGAASVFAKHGSLLERNLIWLLSRVKTEDDARGVLTQLKVNNPIVALQFLNGLSDTTTGARTFKFYKNRKLKSHTETNVEQRNRKSILSATTKELIKKAVFNKIENYYEGLPKIGKVYVTDEFKGISVPLNTSASMGGLSVLPAGSRLPITEDYIRTFCYWNGPRDIDTSVIFVHKTGRKDTFYWANYASKSFGNSALYSGDDRSTKGAEYGDFRISELKALGYTHAIYTLNGFGDNLNVGEIYCGYQNKIDLDTKTWSAKNMALKLKVSGDSRAYMGFAIDFETNEVIILNQMRSSDSRVVSPTDMNAIKQYLNKDYTDLFNAYKLATLRATEIVSTPEEAEVVFSNTYMGGNLYVEDTLKEIKDGVEVFTPITLTVPQKVVRAFDIEKLVALLN